MRRNDWIDQPLRCNAASQIRASRGETRPDLLGYELARNWLGTRADWLGASASLLHTGGPDFHTEINPPNQPAADLSPSPSARRSARSATRSQARAPGQPAPSCPPLRAFAAAIDRTWLLPEPPFLRSSALFLQLLEAQGGRPLFRSCGTACLLETRREGGGRFLLSISQALAPPAPPGHAAALRGCGPPLIRNRSHAPRPHAPLSLGAEGHERPPLSLFASASASLSDS